MLDGSSLSRASGGCHLRSPFRCDSRPCGCCPRRCAPGSGTPGDPVESDCSALSPPRAATPCRGYQASCAICRSRVRRTAALGGSMRDMDQQTHDAARLAVLEELQRAAPETYGGERVAEGALQTALN